MIIIIKQKAIKEGKIIKLYGNPKSPRKSS